MPNCRRFHSRTALDTNVAAGEGPDFLVLFLRSSLPIRSCPSSARLPREAGFIDFPLNIPLGHLAKNEKPRCPSQVVAWPGAGELRTTAFARKRQLGFCRREAQSCVTLSLQGLPSCRPR